MLGLKQFQYSNELLIFFNRNNLEKACEIYSELAQKYRVTPLQFQLIKEILKIRREELLEKVLDCTAQIHGYPSTQAALLAALAESKQIEVLIKMLEVCITNCIYVIK